MVAFDINIVILALQILMHIVLVFRTIRLNTYAYELKCMRIELEKDELWLDRRTANLEKKIDKLGILE